MIFFTLCFLTPFLILGAVFLYQGLHSIFVRWPIVEATIIDWGSVGHNRYPVVEFDLNGTTYTDVQLHSRSSSDYIGKIILIKVNPDDPYKSHASRGYFLFAIVGAAFIFVAGFMLIGVITSM